MGSLEDITSIDVSTLATITRIRKVPYQWNELGLCSLRTHTNGCTGSGYAAT